MRGLANEIIFILAAICAGCAFLVPESLLSLILGWSCAILLVFGSTNATTLRGYVWWGMVATTIGFYWLPTTLMRFGGFGAPIAYLLFALFVTLTVLQLLLCGVLTRTLSQTMLGRMFLAFPLAWFAIEFLFPRIFPWSLSHTQIIWTGFASLAEVLRTELLSSLLIWWAAVIVHLVGKRTLPTPVVVLFAGTLMLLGWGYYRNSEIEQLMRQSPSVRVGLVQGNLTTTQKGDIEQLDANLETYRLLSERAISQGAQLLLWPESVSINWTPESLQNIKDTIYNPYPDLRVPLLYGGLSYRRRAPDEVKRIIDEAWTTPDREFVQSLQMFRFNTAFGLDHSGAIIGRYHKKVLMPFGEFLPFSRKIPAIKQLSPHSGDFDRGDLSEPITFKVDLPKHGLTDLSLMPLICYEDLPPQVSRAGVLRGAQLLVNLTNDAWYGDTAAPYEHNLLALWRAIETRRYLLRVTNTGYTAVVSPLGQTVASLKPFTSDTLVAEIQPLNIRSFYVAVGDLPLRILAWLVIGIWLVIRLRSRL